MLVHPKIAKEFIELCVTELENDGDDLSSNFNQYYGAIKEELSSEIKLEEFLTEIHGLMTNSGENPDESESFTAGMVTMHKLISDSLDMVIEDNGNGNQDTEEVREVTTEESKEDTEDNNEHC